MVLCQLAADVCSEKEDYRSAGKRLEQYCNMFVDNNESIIQAIVNIFEAKFHNTTSQEEIREMVGQMVAKG